MLCSICESFLSDIINQDFNTWRRSKSEDPNWITRKIGNYEEVSAAAGWGCRLCGLFCSLRSERITSYDTLGQKWHSRPASIDYDMSHKDDDDESTRWTFYLLTVAPEMSLIAFEFFRPFTEETLVNEAMDNELGLPLAVQERPDSPRTIQTIKHWSTTCLRGSAGGTSLSTTIMPTRVIDVGNGDQLDVPRLYVSNGARGRYLTLSHCWGTADRLTLMNSNIESFQVGVPLERLAKTFQDAIRLTRLLGHRYIWIDALCIIQDDYKDWEKEAGSMCAVFENAFFSISALAAADSYSGLLQERYIPQVDLELPGLHCGIRKKLDPLETARENSYLEYRAWCLQERLLARAILHIGHDQVFWECRAGVVSEAFPSMVHPRDCLNADNVFRMSKGAHKSIQDNWLSTVCSYSIRNVTKATDRLPAIAGLADHTQKELQGAIYLQGIWSNDLHAGLLWRRTPSVTDRRASGDSITKEPAQAKDIAASWSWASINTEVDYDILQGCSFHSLSRWDVNLRSHVGDREIEGPVPHAYLEVQGYVRRGSCTHLADNAKEREQALFIPTKSKSTEVALPCYMDSSDNPAPKTCYALRIANWKSSAQDTKGPPPEEIATYLILEKMKSSNTLADGTRSLETFVRIGVGRSSIFKANKVFSNAALWHLHLT